MSKPKGILGAKWGDDVGEVMTKLGIVCNEWEKHEAGNGFEICANLTQVKAYGEEPYVRLIKKDTKFEGIQLIFENCTGNWSRLRSSVAKAFGLEAEGSGELYQIWSSGEVVRFTQERSDNICVLTVTGPHFGKVYAANLINRGLGRLSGDMQPH